MAAHVSAVTTPGLSPATRRTAWIVSSVFFIEQLDATIIAPALPAMAADLGSDPITLSSAITAYLLGLTVLIPVSGQLADRFGDKRVFAGAIALFLCAAVACGFAQNAFMLILLRFLQGLAGALMAPVGRLIVLRASARHELVEAMALVILLAMIAPMIGPFAGGVITTYLGWRWIFWIHVPLCLGAWYLVWRYLPLTEVHEKRSFDTVGAILTGVAFASLVYGLTLLGGEHGLDPSHRPFIVAALGVGLALFAVYVVHARRTANPVLALNLLKLRNFRDALFSGSVFRIAVGGVPFLLPLTLQERDGYSALWAGMIVLLPGIGGFAMKFFSTRILRSMGYRNGLVVHGILAAVFLVLAGTVSTRHALVLYVLVLLAFGWARSLQMNAFGTLAYADVARQNMAAATSFFLSIQNLTMALGVAFAAILLRLFQALPGYDTAHVYFMTYCALSATALISAAMCMAMPASAGSQLLARTESR